MAGIRDDYRIKVIKNGPYLVSGGVPLLEQIVCIDSEGEAHGWMEGKRYPQMESYALCRCGQSQNKPFCDGTHIEIKFDGTETANHKSYLEQAGVINGPDLKLTDVKEFCARARFCHRAGGTWKLTKRSDSPEARQIAIVESCECPSGRLVAWDRDDRPIEPDLEPSIGLVQDPKVDALCPIWIRGGIPIESADGAIYEIRNRVTLCRCGLSSNKPFCDGSHMDER
jgi:CDGSH-type Zn-finger protein